MYLRALIKYEKAWGREHKKPLDVRYNLAVMYKDQSMLKDAAKNLKFVMRGYTRILGSEHWETLEALNQLKKLGGEAGGANDGDEQRNVRNRKSK